MKTLIAIPVMGQYEIGRISLYQFDQTTSPDCRFLLIDNSLDDPSPYPSLFDRGFLSHDRWIYRRNPGNPGLIASCQQAYEWAKSDDYDVLVLTHNDVWIYPAIYPDVLEGVALDDYLTIEFSLKKNMGILGLFGSKGCDKAGHRLDTFGSLIEMSGHGRKMTKWIEPAVCLDGFFLACSMNMLNAVGGFDQQYQWHHVYDYDISLASIWAGFNNAVINIPCHHLSGLTANNDAFSTSGPEIHQSNYDLWKAKWGRKLGVSVEPDWNYTWGL